ncbi:hypothetical protein ALC62_00480 [Cyphomyrmex costatus]|uniref:Uncharacterized protein n=1 Tax=Cyphomyrmex costatus TaxID=456900 RepID=A0A195D6K6_9HYME|nr:hypothetical protein ALC62_00480 [Cyphomyrmex costatus]
MLINDILTKFLNGNRLVILRLMGRLNQSSLAASTSCRDSRRSAQRQMIRVRLTRSIAYGLAPGAECLLLGSRRVLLILILRAFMFHWLLRVTIFALLRTG